MRVGKERDGGEGWRSMLYGWLTEYEGREDREGVVGVLTSRMRFFVLMDEL